MQTIVSKKLLYQAMLGKAPVQVFRIHGFSSPTSSDAHRHGFYMLQLTTSGQGRHRINFQEHEMISGRFCFTNRHQVHQVMSYPEDGWILLFDQPLFDSFIKLNPKASYSGLFDYFNRHPYADLDSPELDRLDSVFRLLAHELNHGASLPVIQHYLAALLLQCDAFYQQQYGFHQSSHDAELLRRLKILVGQHFKTEKESAFYSARLGLSARKLNEICYRATGRIVPELVAERLLSEAEALLGATDWPIKQICYELGFVDHAHFAYYFKKMKQMTPSSFRKRFHI